ncbi:MAG: hypothetical protein IJ449_03780 [Clostridia bacterium]|nr:hypothetical protein [Clostridia bacterium]
MKKQLAFALTAVLALSVLASCSGGDDSADTTANTSADTTAAVETTAAPETTEVVTEAPKRDSYAFISTYAESDARTPIALTNGKDSVATHFVVENGYLESISANCPSWSDSIGNLTMKLYKWDTDYDTTVAAEPIGSYTFEDYTDNDTLTWDLSTEDSRGAEPGEYLWVLGDGEDSAGTGVGVWAQAFPEGEDAILGMYKNGKEVASGNGWECDITIVIPAE